MPVPTLYDMIISKDPISLVRKVYEKLNRPRILLKLIDDDLFDHTFSYKEHMEVLGKFLPPIIAHRLSNSVLTRARVINRTFTNTYGDNGDDRYECDIDVLVIEAYYKGVTYDAHYTYEYVESDYGRVIAGVLFVYMVTILAPLPDGCKVYANVRVPPHMFQSVVDDWYNRPQLIRTYAERGEDYAELSKDYDDQIIRMSPTSSSFYGNRHDSVDIDISQVVIDAIEKLETKLLGNYHHSQSYLEDLYGEDDWKEHLIDSPVKIGTPMWKMEDEQDD